MIEGLPMCGFHQEAKGDGGVHYDVWEHLATRHNILREVQDVWEKERIECKATFPKSDND